MTGSHIHLDLLGGIAGDMFAAAALNAFPDLKEPCIEAINALVGDTADITLVDDQSKGFAGARFKVAQRKEVGHRSWRRIREMIEVGLPTDGGKHALGIFRLLAEAEAEVHGCPPDEVHFHEVGAIDSIADIAAAGVVIEKIGAASWSVGPVPLGSGTVKTAHGAIPVPAPATARLLTGFAVVDDGVGGERITPTGAAILAYLAPASMRPRGRLGKTGLGLGSRDLPDRVNALRLLEIEVDQATPQPEQIAVIRFDIDDQTAEDLALALDRLRQTDGVIDVTQSMAIGKKGRSAAQIRMLVKPDRIDEAADQIFRETTTLGLCVERVERRILRRELLEPISGIRAKRASRPGGPTAKAELDDIAANAEGADDRAQLRYKAESAALKISGGEQGHDER